MTILCLFIYKIKFLKNTVILLATNITAIAVDKVHLKNKQQEEQQEQEEQGQ